MTISYTFPLFCVLDCLVYGPNNSLVVCELNINFMGIESIHFFVPHFLVSEPKPKDEYC